MTFSFDNSIGGVSGGETINNQDKTITTNGIYTADEGYTGLGEVDVQVAGGATTEELTVTPTTTTTVYTPEDVDAYSKVTVNGVTNSIDANITANNIKSGVSILGITGNVVELNGETKTVTPTTSEQTITPTSPKNALTSVTVEAVTSSIDANITAGNIKSGVSILGVSGSVTELNAETLSASTNGTYTPTSPKNAYSSVTVNVPSSDYTPSPLNTCGLCMWYDGDCNTRAGLDRSKKYMENLVWNKPYSNHAGNFEAVSSSSSNNTWNDNFLQFKGTYSGLLPDICQLQAWTLEVVIKTISSVTWGSNSFNFYQTLNNNQGIAFFINPGGQIAVGYGTGSAISYITSSASSDYANKAYYCYVTVNGSNISLKVPGLSVNQNKTNYAPVTEDLNVGMFCSSSNSSFTPGTPFSNNDKGATLGMMRGWSRVLTDSEITRNYNDAKSRFNCL